MGERKLTYISSTPHCTHDIPFLFVSNNVALTHANGYFVGSPILTQTHSVFWCTEPLGHTDLSTAGFVSLRKSERLVGTLINKGYLRYAAGQRCSHPGSRASCSSQVRDVLPEITRHPPSGWQASKRCGTTLVLRGRWRRSVSMTSMKLVATLHGRASRLSRKASRNAQYPHCHDRCPHLDGFGEWCHEAMASNPQKDWKGNPH